MNEIILKQLSGVSLISGNNIAAGDRRLRTLFFSTTIGFRQRTGS